jgi:hypothetical protein
MPEMQALIEKMKVEILSPMELWTVSKISAICAGIYSTLLISK